MERQDVLDRQPDLAPLTTSELEAVEGGLLPVGAAIAGGAALFSWGAIAGRALGWW